MRFTAREMRANGPVHATLCFRPSLDHSAGIRVMFARAFVETFEGRAVIPHVKRDGPCNLAGLEHRGAVLSMSNSSPRPNEDSPAESAAADGSASDRKLKAFKYVTASVNNSALCAWSQLWAELKEGTTGTGMVLPKMDEGFEPSCGWAEFLETFWLLKHYLDYMQRFAKSPT